MNLSCSIVKWRARPHASALLLVLHLAVVSACTVHADPGTPADVDPPVEVRVAHPFVGPITCSILLPAQVAPFQQATLYAKVSGYLKSVAVDKGDHVTAGSVLARIEIPELEASRAKQEAVLRAAQSDYTRLQESLQKAPDLVVPDMVDQARGRFEVARASLQESDTLLRYATITAPFTGIITQRYVDPGALIPVGSAGSAIASLMDFATVRLQIPVPEAEAPRIAVGQPATVTTESLPGRHFDGTVTRFSYALDPVSRTMLAEVTLENHELLLRPGMLVEASLGIEHKEQALLIPAEAVVREKANVFTYVAAGNKADKHPIKAGFSDDKNVEVVEGLSVADSVILPGKLKLAPGQAIRVAAP